MGGLIMKVAVIILYLVPREYCIAQVTRNVDSSYYAFLKPGILTNGFIDVMNNGQVNASARFIRISIGDPGKFAIPLSVYSGVSANNFRDQLSPFGERSNVHLLNSFINPLSGILNLSAEGIFYLKNENQFSRVGFPYHVGERVLTGFRTGSLLDPQAGRPVNFLNTVAATGVYFQTGAWERFTSSNIGLFWLVIMLHGCYSHPGNLRSFLQGAQTNGWYLGYSFGLGVHINNLLNLRAVYYKYTKPPEIEYSLPIYQFTFNYSLRN